MISMPERESRAPVGSSASTIWGSLTSACDRNPLLLSAEKVVGIMIRPLGQTY